MTSTSSFGAWGWGWGKDLIGGWVVPTDIPAAEAAALLWLYIATNGPAWTTNTNWGQTATANDWYGVTVGGGKVTGLNVNANNLVGDITSWAIDAFTGATLVIYLYDNAGVTGVISGWSLPATLYTIFLSGTGITGGLPTIPAATGYFIVNNTSLSGDISGTTLSANIRQMHLHSTGFSGAPIMTSAVALRDLQYGNCGLSQANVDAVLLGIYSRRASFTFAAPTLGIAGTNSTPSGVYQDGDPPTTGKEYEFELENDPETEGFNVWVITSTA